MRHLQSTINVGVVKVAIVIDLTSPRLVGQEIKDRRALRKVQHKRNYDDEKQQGEQDLAQLPTNQVLQCGNHNGCEEKKDFIMPKAGLKSTSAN
ncbi:MAG: hypothetical protein CMI26_05280 [Opitutae bacterium]|nr:hypothetical protein [Opitutae bacterium]